MNGEILEDALICSECGVCEKFACPMMLSPREINAVLKKKCLAEGVKRKAKRETYRVSPFFDNRKVPVQRLMQRLEIMKYDAHPEFYPEEIKVRQVKILLNQHLGEPALPVVAAGDRVQKGDVVGEIPEGALGARVHASIDGTVSAIDDKQVVIQSR
jgi:Na+-translocating ferredoxin:NAD+ oxidoreductase RnfC subunit